MTITGAFIGFFLLSGAGPVALPAHAAPAPQAPGYAVTLTAYNAVPEQTDGDPFTTASGAYSNPAVVAARSRDLAEELPFGTVIEVDGSDAAEEGCGYAVVKPLIGYRVIADTMNARYTSRIDLLFGTKKDYPTTDRGMRNAAEILGICDGVSIRVVGRIDIRDIPKTQFELATLMRGGDGALALK